jgi:hypothetical protein
MQILVGAIVAIVMGWFAIGTIYNIRKGESVMRWMQGGLPLIGERTTVRWLGTTAVEMKIVKAKPPFEQASLVIFMEPRDVPWFWGIARAQGRRDTLIIRAQLRTSPHADFEALDRKSWSGRDALRRIESERWTVSEPTADEELAIHYKTEGALERANLLLKLARESGFVVRRLSLRHSEPHLQIHLALPAASASAHDFFQTIQELGEKAGG